MKKSTILIIILGCIIIGGASIFIYFKSQDTSKPINTNDSLTTTSVSGKFTLKADNQDSIGVEPNSTFTLTSKEKIEPEVIQLNLAINPEFTYIIESSDNNKFTLIPQENLKANTIYSFSMTAEQGEQTKNRQYNWAYQIKDTFKITGSIPKDKATNVPTDSGIEITFSHENYTNYQDYISISPSVEGRFQKYRKTLVFVPDSLMPATIYTVKINKGLPLLNSDESISEDYSWKFETHSGAQAEGNISFESDFYEFPIQQPPVLSIYEYDTNLSQINVNLWKFSNFDEFQKAVYAQANAYPFWAYYARKNNPYATDSMQLQSSFLAEIKTSDSTQYIELPEALSAGQYIVEIEFNNQKIQAFLQSTDILASFQGSKEKSFIWLHDVNNSDSISNAIINFSENEQFSQKTDTNGLSIFDTPEQLSTISEDSVVDKLYFFTAIKGEDKILIPSIKHYESWWGYGGRAIHNDYWSYLYTNRNLYQPSDSVKFWGVVKNRTQDAPSEVIAKFAPSSYWYDSTNLKIIAEQTLTISDFNTYQGSIDYTNLNPGSYSLKVYADDNVIATTYVSIQSYTKPAYKIEITSPSKAIFEGDDAIYDITTSFFDGTPVANLELSYSSAFGKGTITTDENGKAQVVYTTSFTDNSYYPDYKYFSAYPTKTEITEISGNAYIYTFGPYYGIEMTANKDGLISGSVHTISLDKINQNGDEFVWDFEGDPVAGATTTLDIFHQYYEKIEKGTRYDFINKKTYKTYDYVHHSDLVEQVDVTTNKNGEFTYNFSPQDKNNYKIVASVTDKQGRTAKIDRYIYRGYYGSFYNYYGYDTYYLKPEKTSNESADNTYIVDEDVDLTFYKNENPLSTTERNNFIYFKDHNGIFEVESTNSPLYNFDFKQEYVPNLYTYGLYFDGRNYHLTPSTNISFDRRTKELNIDISPDKNEYRPGEDVQIDFSVTDLNNQPVSSEINVSLIDEALAAIQWNNPPSILYDLYKQLRPSLTVSYSTHKELSAPMAEGGGCFTGDTQILMSDGTEKSIKDINVGETILTKTNESESNLEETVVKNKYIHLVNEYWTINKKLNITPVHVVYLNGEWQPIAKAKIGDYLTDSDNNKVKIFSIEKHERPTIVYNLETSQKHTFIAENIYVHNEKAGGRENFQDIAFFDSVTTNNQGQAQIKFTLPDNITSWQTTIQAVTKNFQATGRQTAIIVTKPFFVDIALAKTYLTSDKPIVKIRGFGKSLDANDVVNYEITYPDLDNRTENYQANSFESLEISLPNFSEGQHKIIVKGTSGVYEDTIIKTVNYQSTNLLENKINYYQLQQNIDIEGSTDKNTTLLFMNKERGQYYNLLKRLLYSYGDRLDQKAARHYTQKILNNYFGEEAEPETIDFTSFQDNNGGLAILPYASPEILFTAKVMEFASDVFDQQSVIYYFNSILNDRNSNTDEIAYALFGLANLSEPVLIDILNFIDQQNLSPELKLYLARGIANLGAGEYAKTIYDEIFNSYAEQVDPYIRINLGQTEDDYIEYTYQAAILASEISSSDADKLFNYAQNNRASYQLNTLEQLSYLKKTIPLLSGEPVSFDYILENETKSVSLTNNQSLTLILTPQQLNSISFINLVGNIGLVSTYQMPIDISQEDTDSLLSIKRSYSVNGQDATTFKEDDIVKITLTPTINPKAIDNSYQLIDYLPGGLKLLTNLRSRNIEYEKGLRYPYEKNNQAVKFWSSSSSQFFYYAIVIGKGEYTAESATLQGMVVQDSKTYGTNQIITIE